MTSENQQKYVVCHAVDADPRSRSAAATLTRDTNAVLDGLLIAGRDFGATQAYLCVDSGDEEQAGAAVETALAGVGDRIPIEVVPVTASLVLEDESALLRVLEGRQAIPYVGVPPSATRALRGRPALVYRVETLAGLARGGPVTRTLTVWWQGEAHVVEALPGATLRAVVRDVTGVGPEAGCVETVRFGGATGRFYAGPGLDKPIGPEAEQPCGVLEVIPTGTCGVELARDATRYLSDQSCGACVACREGTRQMADILEDVVAFRAEERDLELLVEVAAATKAGSICSLGRTAPAPVLSSLEVFAADYKAHMDDRRCLGEQAYG